MILADDIQLVIINHYPQFFLVIALVVLAAVQPNMLEVLGSWLWNAPTTSTSPAKKSPIKKSPVKTRAQQVAAKPSTGSSDYYPGLVNISGTYCFLNSTLQVSLPTLI